MNKADLEKLGLTTEALEKAGLNADVLDKVIVAHGKDIESHKTKLSTADAETKTLKSQLTEANTTIEGFKKLNVDEIQKTANDYKTKFEQAQADTAAQLNALKFDHALESALAGAKAKNPKAVQALLSKDLLKLNDADGSIVGLNEQLETIKKDNDYLFLDTKEPPKIVAGGNNQPVITDAFEAALMRGARIPEAKK